jgi:hypothetical protein
MVPARITKFEVQGFRAFHLLQTFELDAPLAAVWGPNSQGKTSLAEAFEFLFIGKIIRRELMASSQDEFADALRNAHMPAAMTVFVRAHVTSQLGEPHVICRTLLSDYSKRQDCASRLEIDGLRVAEAALGGLGFVLSHPPLSAPVLAQHTLGYLFSARPQDRATYFRALLEVSDLEAFRIEVAALEAGLASVDDPMLAKMAAAASIPVATSFLRLFATSVPSADATAAALDGAIRALTEAERGTAAGTATERLSELTELLATKRLRTFPVKGFDHKPQPAAVTRDEKHADRLRDYLAERAKVDRETRRLTALFKELLQLPVIEHSHNPIDCPVCGTEGGLTPERIEAIRQSAADTDAFQAAERNAIVALHEVTTALTAAATDIAAALPLFMQYPATARRQRSFRIERIKALLEQEGSETLAPWLAAVRPFVRAQRNATVLVARSKRTIAALLADMETLTDQTSIDEMLAGVSAAIDTLTSAWRTYETAEAPLAAAIKKAVDRESLTGGWQDLIDLAGDQTAFRDALVERAVANDLRKELLQALKQIYKGNETVLEEKFGELSAGVQGWWDLLRPHEHSFFSAVKPRPSARRSIDFKAGLGDGGDRKTAKLRDVIAVFSQSQLHCLGLAVFLARAVHEKAGFIVLDDPILASDEDYRAYFKLLVVERLLDCGIQTVLITQCKDTWRDISDLHGHRGVASFQIRLADPKKGTAVIKSGDEFLAMLTKIEPFTLHDDLELRKIGGGRIRDGTERFCKLLLVKKARDTGNAGAVITDYKDKGLDELIPLITAYLEQVDPSHAGKLRVLRRDSNPANHDDDVPTMAALRTGLGVLREFRRVYLG